MSDDQEIARFGGGGETVLHPAAVLLTLVAILLVLLLPRKYVVIPLFVICFFLPFEQKIMVAGLHFSMLRVLLIFCWVRVILNKLLGGRAAWKFQTNAIDTTFTLSILSGAFFFVLLWREWGAVINRMGGLYTSFGIYFLVRYICQDEEDVDRTIRVLALICVPIALCMLNEQLTGRNLFWIFGGVPEFVGIREGALRAQGPFAHPVLAGAFGATLFPLFFGLWWGRKQSRTTAIVGIISAVVMVFASMSSTPLLAFVAGIIGLSFWPLRKQMRIIRWGLLCTIVGLHLVMKAPVWALIARVDVVGGSSGYHRYELVNQCIRHFSDWWLCGYKYPGKWGFEMADTANAFVDVATTTGLIPLIFFISNIVYGFKGIGAGRKRMQGDPVAERRLWVLGVALFANVMGFFGIVYFDQTIIAWYALLAMIAVASTVTKPEEALATSSVSRFLPRAAERLTYQHLKS